MSEYVLMNKDRILAEFDIVGEGAEEYCENICAREELPWWINDLTPWIRNRSAAKHRRFVKKLLQEYNAEDLRGFISLTNCLSLQDTLWIKKADSGLCWEKVNLFENRFDEVMTHLAFDGTGLYGKQISTTSPELTTDGAYDKCWINRDDDIVLMKAGSSGARNAGKEPFGEVLASQLFNEICIGSVSYNLERFRGRYVSACSSFSNVAAGYKPYSLFLKDKVYLEDVKRDMMKRGYSDKFASMIVADCITLNSDRHFGNFGFLVDNDTYEILDLAPVFDLNMSFTPYAEEGIDLPVYDDYLEKHGPSLGENYVDPAKRMLTPEMRSLLINLKDLELTLPEEAYEEGSRWSRKRTAMVNEIKNIQIDRILGNGGSFSFADGEISGDIPEKVIGK